MLTKNEKPLMTNKKILALQVQDAKWISTEEQFKL